MAKYASKDIAAFLVGGRDLKAITGEITHDVTMSVVQTDGFGKAAEEYTATDYRKMTLTQSGFFDDAADSSHEALTAQLGESVVGVILFMGNTAGRPFTGFSGALETKYERLASRGDLHRANAEYANAGEVEEGIVIFALDEIEGDYDTEAASINNTAATDAGGAIYLQVMDLDLDDYTGLTITVQHSANDADWSTLETFTGVTTAPTAERIAITGDIYQYVSIDAVFTGEGEGDPVATFLVGLVRNPTAE